MRPDYIARKYEAARAIGANGLTIAVDRRGKSQDYYWQYGFAGYRLGG